MMLLAEPVAGGVEVFPWEETSAAIACWAGANIFVYIFGNIVLISYVRGGCQMGWARRCLCMLARFLCRVLRVFACCDT